MIPAWASGKGASGIIAILIWNKSRALGVILPILSIPVAIINLYVFFFLIKTPIMTRSDSITEEQQELIGFKNKIAYIPKLFKYMIPLGLAVIFQLLGSQLIVRIHYLLIYRVKGLIFFSIQSDFLMR